MSLSIIQKRSTTCFTQELQEAIHLIALEAQPIVVGSYSYIAHPYPGDIDMFESVEFSGTVQQASAYFAKLFKHMFQRIRDQRNVYLSDFKAGEDRRYIIDWNQSDSNIMEQIKQLYHQRLLGKSETDKWISALKNDKSKCIEMARNKQILRWTLKEIDSGIKKLPGNVNISLAESLAQQTIVKIDLIILVNGYYTEMTNLFKLSARNPQTKQIISLTQPDTDYQESLRQDLKKYSNPVLGKHLKLAKRFWSYSVLTNSESQLKKLKPLLESGAARLGQVESLIETIILLYEKIKRVPETSIEQIQRLNFAIGSIPHNILSKKDMNEICEQIHSIHSVHSVHNKTRKSKIISVLKSIQEILHHTVDHYSYQYLKQHRLLSQIKKEINQRK